MMEEIKEAVDFIKGLYSERPVVGVVLGSGLGSFTNEIKIEKDTRNLFNLLNENIKSPVVP